MPLYAVLFEDDPACAARVRHTAVRPIPSTAMIWASGTPRSSEDRT